MAASLKRRLSAQDAMFLYMERAEQPMNVGAVFVFEGKLPFARLLKHVDTRLHLLPRYRQRVCAAPLHLSHPTWEDDEQFTLADHVSLHHLDAPGGEVQLRDLAGRIFSTVLDREKPLWEMHLVHGLSEKRSALILKAHHCVADGVSGIGLAQILFDLSPRPKRVRKAPFRPRPLPNASSLLYDALWDNATERVEYWTRLQNGLLAFGGSMQSEELKKAIQKFTSTVGSLLLPLNKLPFNGALTGDRRMAWRSFPLPEIQALRARYECTVNDVALAIISGAVRRYLLRHSKEKLPQTVRVLEPVHMRRKEDNGSLGNRVSFLPVEVPLEIEAPVARLQAIHQIMGELKALRVAGAISLMFETLQAMPAMVQALSLESIGNSSVQAAVSRLAAIPPANLLCTNVPGPPVPLYALGHRMLDMYATLPVCLEMGLSIAVTSYDQRLSLTLTEDGRTGAGAELLAAYLEESYLELKHAAASNGKRAKAPARPPARKRRAGGSTTRMRTSAAADKC